MWSLLALAGLYDLTPNSLIAEESIKLVDWLAYSNVKRKDRR